MSGGVGNGMGVEVRVGGVRAVAEVRAILARDLRGGQCSPTHVLQPFPPAASPRFARA